MDLAGLPGSLELGARATERVAQLALLLLHPLHVRRRLVEVGLELLHLRLHGFETSGRDTGLVRLGLEFLGTGLQSIVASPPGRDLALVVLDLGLELLVLALHGAQRLRQLDNLVLQLVRDLLEIPRLGAYDLVLPACRLATPQALDKSDPPAVLPPRAQASP